MIRFKIFRGEKDESETIFIQQEDNDRQKLVFEVIKTFSLDFLVKSTKGEDCSYEIEVSDPSLDSYKEIITSVFDSVIKDDELRDLYKEMLALKDASEAKWYNSFYIFKSKRKLLTVE